ncbi:MAG: dihydroorotate dehydrogenase electron transfer subunit, partial [Eubacteriales bacterium]|nr:dihydroorotate dehydrogenase electron transfer subunit [Eubacteriales bacterium]
QGVRPDVLMGGRTADELFWQDLYVDLVGTLALTTDDGSLGTKGTVMALLDTMLANGGYDCVYVCGPVPMMKAVSSVVLEQKMLCQVSLEKYMACGLGACLSCSCQGIGKRIKVCKDGPVFWAQEVAEW